MLAQALVHDPRLLLLDEPTNGLDPGGRDEMLALIHRTGTEFGIAIILASHLLGEIERVCDFLVAIEGGRLLQAAPLRSFTERTGVVRVQVDDDPAPLAARLAGAGLQVRVDGQDLLVVVDDLAIYDTVRDAAADLGLGLARIEPLRRSLEDLFRDEPVTAGGRRVTTPPPPRRRRPPNGRLRPRSSRAGSAGGSIYDLGYRSYLGPRLGRRHAVASLVRHSFRQAFGLGRPLRSKVIPMGLLLLTLLPAVVALGFAALASRLVGPGGAMLDEANPITYDTYASLTIQMLALFTAAQAPELLGRDLRYRVVALYFTRALRRDDYALAKLAAMVLAMLLITVVPYVLLFLGRVLVAADIAAGSRRTCRSSGRWSRRRC